MQSSTGQQAADMENKQRATLKLNRPSPSELGSPTLPVKKRQRELPTVVKLCQAQLQLNRPSPHELDNDLKLTHAPQWKKKRGELPTVVKLCPAQHRWVAKIEQTFPI
ncbi:hypothetical protein Bbelb_205450 [Branchiostoma belcheri]|nr:hypothetical protein Bbelb_205450 [Branchiostoma belcheri]